MYVIYNIGRGKWSMNRKVLLLLICLHACFVVGAMVIYEFSPHIYAIRASIGKINSNPSTWVNKLVAVQGKLVGPLGFIVETMPPWNHQLFGINETIETIYKEETVVIGVLWNGKDDYSFEKTRIVGVVREGHWLYLWGEHPVCYYIEAKKIDRT
jgi:hypothetical protein